jgi:hypothetical protein
VADWVVISSLATAGGTLGLAATTYASVRSANRAARAAELSLLAELRPLLLPSSPTDASQRIDFADGVFVTAPGGGAGVDVVDGSVYVGVSLRNVGPGIGVLHGAAVYPERRTAGVEHAPLDEFRRLQRDLYVASGKIGFWQTAFRDGDSQRDEMRTAVERGAFSVDILYGDYEGGQRVISRFGVRRSENGEWEVIPVRHWQVDRSNPR